MNRLLIIVIITKAVVGNEAGVGADTAGGAGVDNADNCDGVRRRRGRVPDVPAARRGRVPRVPVLISFIIIIVVGVTRLYISIS